MVAKLEAVQAKAQVLNTVSEIDAILPNFKELTKTIGKANASILATQLEGDDRMTCLFVLKGIARKVVAFKKKDNNENNLKANVRENIQKWIEGLICDLSQELDAAIQERELLAAFAEQGKTAYIVYSASLNEAGGVATIKRGKALPVRAMDNEKLIKKVATKVTAPNRTERRNADGTINKEARVSYISLVTLAPGMRAKEAFFEVTPAGDWNEIVDYFHGKRVNILRGIKSVHEAV